MGETTWKKSKVRKLHACSGKQCRNQIRPGMTVLVEQRETRFAFDERTRVTKLYWCPICGPDREAFLKRNSTDTPEVSS